MIADSASLDKKPLQTAAEDSLIIGGFSFVSGLIATGSSFPPEASVLYATGLAALMAGILSWAKARNISVK